MSIVQERTKMMLTKLYELMAEGHIDDEWAEIFIVDMAVKSKISSLSDKQIAKIEQLFERY